MKTISVFGGTRNSFLSAVNPPEVAMVPLRSLSPSFRMVKLFETGALYELLTSSRQDEELSTIDGRKSVISGISLFLE